MKQVMRWYKEAKYRTPENPRPQPKAFDGTSKAFYGGFQGWAGEFFRIIRKHKIGRISVAFLVEMSRRKRATELPLANKQLIYEELRHSTPYQPTLRRSNQANIKDKLKESKHLTGIRDGTGIPLPAKRTRLNRNYSHHQKLEQNGNGNKKVWNGTGREFSI